MDTSKFVTLCKTVNGKIDYKAEGPPKAPFQDAFDANDLVRIVKQASPLLPVAYQTGYADRLIDALPQLVPEIQQEIAQIQQSQQLTQAEQQQYAAHFFEPLIGAVYDLSVPQVSPQLHRFEAVISDLYRSFLSKQQRESSGIPLVEQLPPLATFGSQDPKVQFPPGGLDGPYTLPSDDMKNTTGATIGVVSLPSVLRDHPLLWAALAHETGGHDVVHADPKLLPELRTGVAKALSDKSLGELWAFWMDEAVADVYGLLNLGPAFVFNLAAFFTTLVHQLEGKPIGILSNQTYLDSNNRPDVHPTDVLRVSLARGVVENLHGLSIARRNDYLQAIDALLAIVADGETTIDFVGNGRVVNQFPLADMQAAAQQAGAFIVNAKFAALGNHSIQDIETWDDSDEDKVQSMLTTMNAGGAVGGMGDDAQVLATATLALLQAPNKYDAVTKQINDALDVSFASDPVFGSLRPHRMLFRPSMGPHRHINSERFFGPPTIAFVGLVVATAKQASKKKKAKSK